MRIFFRTLFGLTAALLACLGTLAQTNITVSEMAAMPEPVSNNAVAEGFVDGVPYVYSFAGIDTTRHHNGIHLKAWRYNTATDVWEAIPSLPDTAGKVAASASRVGDMIYIIGGYHVAANSNEYTSDRVHRYDVASNTYLSDGAPPPTPVDDQVQVVWRDSLIICITGWSGSGASGTNVNAVQIYNPSTNSWSTGTSVPDNNDYKVFGANGTIVGDTIYYFGGARLGFNFPASNSFVKGAINPNNPTDITWERVVPNPAVLGYRTAATQRYGQAYWLGGSSRTFNYDGLAYSNNQAVDPSELVLSYEPTSGTWDTMTVALPMDLRGLATTDVNTRYIVGGMLNGPTVSDKTWKLEFSDANSVPEVAESGMRVYPVPAEEWLRVELPEQHIDMVRLYALDGRLVLTARQARVDVSDLKAGVYLLEAHSNGSLHRQRIVLR